MIVVSDTSPLTNLAAVGQLHLFHLLHGEIHISEAVWKELNAEGKPWPGSHEVARSSWIKRHPLLANDVVKALLQDLHHGEAESIALALDLRAELVLIDDAEARRVAEHMGLNVVGLLGVLLSAKARGHLAQVRPVMDSLRHQAGFFIGDAIYQYVIKAAGEGDR